MVIWAFLLTTSDCYGFGDIYGTDWLLMCHGLNVTVCGFRRTDQTDPASCVPLPTGVPVRSRGAERSAACRGACNASNQLPSRCWMMWPLYRTSVVQVAHNVHNPSLISEFQDFLPKSWTVLNGLCKYIIYYGPLWVLWTCYGQSIIHYVQTIMYFWIHIKHVYYAKP